MEGRTVPDIVFKARVRDDSVPGPNPYRWQDVRSCDLFSGRRVVVFSLPGAFTPTCSNRQCPAYDLAYARIRERGIDEVYCSVNDAFVMHQWARTLGLKHVKPMPDGNGQFTRRMGMLVSKEHLGFGYRSWRYAMVVREGVNCRPSSAVTLRSCGPGWLATVFRNGLGGPHRLSAGLGLKVDGHVPELGGAGRELIRNIAHHWATCPRKAISSRPFMALHKPSRVRPQNTSNPAPVPVGLRPSLGSYIIMHTPTSHPR